MCIYAIFVIIHVKVQTYTAYLRHALFVHQPVYPQKATGEVVRLCSAVMATVSN